MFVTFVEMFWAIPTFVTQRFYPEIIEKTRRVTNQMAAAKDIIFVETAFSLLILMRMIRVKKKCSTSRPRRVKQRTLKYTWMPNYAMFLSQDRRDPPGWRGTQKYFTGKLPLEPNPYIYHL